MKTKLTLFVTVLAAALLGVGCVSTPETSPPLIRIEPAFVKEGLVAYYPFYGNAKDESGNGNDGDVTGATLTGDRHGKPNSAYSFDGASEIKAAKPKELTHINTISC